MEVIQAKYINDGVGFHKNQVATVAKVESDADCDAMLKNIIDSNYYDKKYFHNKVGFRGAGMLTNNLWYVASMILKLKPKRSLEVGCGKGDVVYMLLKAGLDSYGVDFSTDIVSETFPDLNGRMIGGDFREVCVQLHAEQKVFDTIIGLDVWEHLSPSSIDEYVAAATRLLSAEGMVFVVVPAFGEDEVFGTQFPLEFEENRAALESGKKFSHLLLESIEPIIPAAGHLIWAGTEWWVKLFENSGLVREPSIERRIHRIFDQMLPHSNKTFYVFRRDTEEARGRTRRILRGLRIWPAKLQKLANFFWLYYRTEVIRDHVWAVSPLDYICERAPKLAWLRKFWSRVRRYKLVA